MPVVWQNTDVRLRLVEQHGVCSILAANNSAQSVNLPWPCQFHLNKQGRIREVKQGKYVYLIIESTRQLPEKKDCETHLRALRIRGKHWQLSEFQDKVASCPPFQWDQMMFNALFK